MLNKKGIIGIALFVVVALFTYAFASPNQNAEEEKEKGNNTGVTEQQEKQNDDATDPVVNPTPAIATLPTTVQNVVTPLPVALENTPVIVVNKSLLSEAISKANDVLEKTETINEEIIAILEKIEAERNKGNNILDNNNATQNEVDNQTGTINNLLDELNNLLDDLYEQVEELVALQEEENTKENIDNAKDALDLLPEGDKKNDFEKRIKDIIKPVITLGEYESTIELGSKKYIMPIVSANDNYDGDITDKIVKSGTIDLNTVGTYTIKYNVTDAALNEANEVSFSVNVVDTTKPVITYPKNNGFYNSSKALKIIDLSDCTIYNDGVIVDNYFGKDGIYNVKAVDKYNNSSETITFTIDKTKPSIEKIKSVIIRKGNEYKLPDWKYSDTNLNKVTITLNDKKVSDVKMTEVGTYTYKIVVTDKAGNSNTESMIVTIVDDSNLKNIISSAEEILNNKQNDESLKQLLINLTNAKNNGNNVLNNQESTQENINNAYSNIKNYVDQIKNEQFTVKYINDDNSELSSKKVKYGSKIPTTNDPEKEGHTFIGWDLDPSITNVYGNLTIKASYSANSYNAVFKINGKEYKTVSYKYGETIIAPVYTADENYIFSGWNTKGETMIVGGREYDATLKLDIEKLRNNAIQELIDYKNGIAFNDEYGTLANGIVEEGKKAINNSNTIDEINTTLTTYEKKLDELYKEQLFQATSKFKITFDSYNTGICKSWKWLKCTEWKYKPNANIEPIQDMIWGFIPTINNIIIQYDNKPFPIVGPSIVDISDTKYITITYTVLKDGIPFGTYKSVYEIKNNNGTRTTTMNSNKRIW